MRDAVSNGYLVNGVEPIWFRKVKVMEMFGAPAKFVEERGKRDMKPRKLNLRMGSIGISLAIAAAGVAGIAMSIRRQSWEADSDSASTYTAVGGISRGAIFDNRTRVPLSAAGSGGERTFFNICR